MNVRFYLKRSKSGSSTAIYAVLNYKYKTYKYYLPYKVNPSDWDCKSQRMSPAGENSAMFNQLLSCAANKIDDILHLHISAHGGRWPTPEKFRTLLDEIFQRRRVHKAHKIIGRFDIGNSRMIVIIQK